jgi:hypothetical protein
MDYSGEWQSRTDDLLAAAFMEYRDGADCDLHYFIDDKVSGMSHGRFPVPRSEEKGNPIMQELLRRTLPDRLKGFDPQTTEIRFEWR